MKNEMIDVPGETLNDRLERQIRNIERTSILLEELKVDPAESLALEKGLYKELSELLSEYEEFLDHFVETTEDLARDVRDMIGCKECFEGERDLDEDILEPLDEDEDGLE